MTAQYPLRDFSDASPDEIQDALEEAEVVFFPKCPVELPPQPDLEYLRAGLSGDMRVKNISFHPESDSIPGFDAAPDEKQRVEQILRTHGRRVEAYLESVLPDLSPGWMLGTTSFRPVEEKGRRLKPRSSNELVHVDAGAYGATNGSRILRFFVNVHPDRDRVWGTKGSFRELMERYDELWKAARGGKARIAIDKSPLDRLYSGLIHAVSKAYPLVQVLDSSPYDRSMRRIHNRMKESEGFRSNTDDYREIRFPPMSAWMVFTDGISHSVLTGQYAFVTTALVPLANCRKRALSPYEILSRAA